MFGDHLDHALMHDEVPALARGKAHQSRDRAEKGVEVHLIRDDDLVLQVEEQLGPEHRVHVDQHRLRGPFLGEC